jgi:hypothetical protein
LWLYELHILVQRPAAQVTAKMPPAVTMDNVLASTNSSAANMMAKLML